MLIRLTQTEIPSPEGSLDCLIDYLTEDVEIIPDSPDFIPRRETLGAACFDVFANIEREITINPGHHAKIDLGFRMHIVTPFLKAVLVPRSGFGTKGLVVKNLIGTIDSDYQGRVLAVVWNNNGAFSGAAITIKPKMRIAQLGFEIVPPVKFVVVEAFSNETKRGEGGFGHTGES